MPFRDSYTGTTHYFGDGCGMPEHNEPMTQHPEKEPCEWEEKQIKMELYRLADSFLVEAKNQHGEERSLERLNQDRHLFVDNASIFIRQLLTSTREEATALARREERERYLETNIKKLVEEMRKDAEEYGQYHDDECPLMREGGGDIGDECECEKINALKSFANEWMGKVNQMWVANLFNHRKHCTPKGNKEMTCIKNKILAPTDLSDNIK